jgi:hypothetical protein
MGRIIANPRNIFIKGAKSIDWDFLIFEEVKRKDIQRCVKNEQWQKFRKTLKGKTSREKFNALKSWLNNRNRSYCAKVQVTNYVNALKRGGTI